MKKPNIQTSAIAIFLLIILAIGGYLFYKKYSTQEKTYTNSTYGVRFSYPKGYQLTESKMTDPDGTGTLVTLIKRGILTPHNGETPTSMTIAMYDGAPRPQKGMTGVETWIATSPYSSFKLSNMKAPGTTQIGEQDARLYTWDGLYPATTVVTEHAGNILMFTVTYDGGMDTEQLQTFTAIVATVEFFDPQNETRNEADAAPAHATLTGTYECLPHTNTGGVTTTECAFGIQASNGNHYALDLSTVPSATMNTAMNTRIEVSGILVPIEQISSDTWQSYPIKGIMKVDSFKKL